MYPLTDIFTDSRPCQICRGDGPTFTDRETLVRYCLYCLENALDEAHPKMAAEAIGVARDTVYQGKLPYFC